MSMPKKPEKTLPLLFVDTNILLNFYRARGEAGLTLLERLASVADSLIMTDQVEVEFINNRRNVIDGTLKGIAAPTIPVPAYLVASRVANSIEKHQEIIRTQIKNLKEKVNGILDNPAKNDPVLRIVKKMIAKESDLSMKFAPDQIRKQIFDSAFLRHHRNFPPRKPKDHSIGDAINWEWIVHCAERTGRNTVIVAEDCDYGENNILLDCLTQEFAARTKCKAELVSKPSEGLQKLDVRVTAAELKDEQKMIEKKPTMEYSPAFWPLVSEKLKTKSPALYGLVSLADAIDYASDTLRIQFQPRLSFAAQGLLAMDPMSVLQAIFSELGYAPLKGLNIGTAISNVRATPGSGLTPYNSFCEEA